jgi:(p)ppGpp synthase/HD superfamily hydrolase
LLDVLTRSYTRAFEYAWDLHGRETRKGGDIPYLAHVMAVSALVLQHGGSEEQAVAALLHDTAEDHGGRARLDDIRDRFGPDVADIVELCSDSLVADRTRKAPWWPRKVAYVQRFAALPYGSPALLVAAADKLDNARALLADYRVDSENLWQRFNRTSGRAGQLWYYGRLADILSERLAGDATTSAVTDELATTIVQLRAEIVRSGAADPDTLDREAELARAREGEISATPRAG